MKTCRSRLLLLSCLLAIAGCAARQKATPPETAAAEPPSADTATAPPDSATAASSSEDTGRPEGGAASPALSPASRLMIRACDNYLAVNPKSQKAAEVLSQKASVYYNQGLYDKSRDVYRTVIEQHGDAAEAVDAVRMVAQSFYQQKHFEQAQEWYRKLRDMAGTGSNKEEATARIAESIFRMAEAYEAEERYEEAAAQYERVALEFPDAAIADVALFNAGLAYEKLAEWSRAILVYQRLRQRYEDSKLVAKSMFRSAKAYEKLHQWEEAAELYLRLVAAHPSTDMTSAALYNAGFCFENAGKLVEAAATFEKLATVFPKSDDAADVLFRAGELYGKLKDWPNVTRVNQEFSRRYGNDADRVVQALCMVGVALYMQEKHEEAIAQLTTAVSTFRKLSDPSAVNRHYAAKAQFTIAEIFHGRQNDVKLTLPRSAYRRRLKDKSSHLDRAVEAYSKVIRYGISEWTTRSIFQIGQAYEDFALGIFRQERPSGLSLDDRIALELGIAKAVEEYFVDRALSYHEQNVKLGLKEKIEDKYVVSSRKKLTYLPTVAGQNYLKLADIAAQAEAEENLDGFALIAGKLATLQKVGPFQERAIALFLKTLELGTRYQEYNESYKAASRQITKTSFTVGTTYSGIADIALGAPIPETFDAYERFVYKTKLLKQIEDYVESSLANFLKTLKIAEAYGIEDDFVARTKERIPKLLFIWGRSYDLLCITAIQDPPFPADAAGEEEKAEYRVRFEEIGLRLQEEAFDLYRRILDYADKGYAAGEYVNHAYVRMYQIYPQDYGVAHEKKTRKSIASGPQWRCSSAPAEGWQGLSYDHTDWDKVRKASLPESLTVTGFPEEKVPPTMWCDGDGAVAVHACFRRTFYVTDPPLSASLHVAAADSFAVYLNDQALEADTGRAGDWNAAAVWDLTGSLRQGKNVLAIEAVARGGAAAGVVPLLSVTVMTREYLPRFPGTDAPIDREIVSPDTWQFPIIKNFTPASMASSEAAEQGRQP